MAFLFDWVLRPLLLAAYVIPPLALLMFFIDLSARRGANPAQRNLLSTSIWFKVVGLLLAALYYASFAIQWTGDSVLSMAFAPIGLAILAFGMLALAVSELLLALSFVLDWRALVVYRNRDDAAASA